ncbi:hypothetical protein ES703_104883 [subsurface metagenome]
MDRLGVSERSGWVGSEWSVLEGSVRNELYRLGTECRFGMDGVGVARLGRSQLDGSG